ncbi:MAG: hypothetical protein K2I93_07735 [Oscillospiraceae bacterium]|nr:hypothetical protein [Oscillospiraceae bacterium]
MGDAMLTGLLSRQTCAMCRKCCVFGRYDVLNTPVLNSEVRQKTERLLPEARFLSKGEASWLFRMEVPREDGMFTCPLLHSENGCMLGDEKPFTCRIWPVQIMDVNGRLAITVSPLCEAIAALPLGTLLRFVKTQLAEEIFSYADAHPDEVQSYDGLSPVLVWKPQKI